MAQAQLDSSLTDPHAKTMDAQDVYRLVQSDLLLVEQSLKQIVPPETALLAQSINYSMQLRGKLLRPVLAILASGASGEIDNRHIEMGAVAELIHVATLLHDDVLDNSDMRRGRTTVKAQWGNKVSILSGDYLLAQASLKLSKLNQCRLVSIFAEVLSNLCEGEVEQINTSFNMDTTWDAYFKKSICKTASLFSACCESAGVLNALPEAEIQQLKQYGEKFGIAFQIIDDLLDYTSSAEQMGKPVLDDLKNGLLNAPILLALDWFSEQSRDAAPLRQLVSALFQTPDAEPYDAATQEKLKKDLFALLHEANAIQRTQALAEQYAQAARDAIAFLPDNQYKQALIAITHYALKRES